jgi:hypothetical protein
MRKRAWVLALAFGLPASAKTFSVECVDNYVSCVNQMLSSRNAVCDDFIDSLSDAGLTKKWDWRDGDVWGNDFRDSVSTEEYSDEADIFFYGGHGTCKGAQGGTCDRPFVCTNNSIGGSNTVVVETQSKWGSLSPSGKKARWVLLDASCVMQVVPSGTNSQIVSKLSSGWFGAFQGLHLATGSHCSPTGDIFDDEDRAEDYAEDLADGDTYSDAWMDNGLTDVQDGACAVIMAVGSTSSIAVSRRDNETLFHSVSDSGGSPHSLAYRFTCE